MRGQLDRAHVCCVVCSVVLLPVRAVWACPVGALASRKLRIGRMRCDAPERRSHQVVACGLRSTEWRGRCGWKRVSRETASVLRGGAPHAALFWSCARGVLSRSCAVHLVFVPPSALTSIKLAAGTFKLYFTSQREPS